MRISFGRVLSRSTLLVLVAMLGFSSSSGQTSDWVKGRSAFDGPQWKVVKGSRDAWRLGPRQLSCRLIADEPSWLLSGAETSGSWALEATVNSTFDHRDEGVLINTASDLSRGYLVSLGPMGKLSLLRIKDGAISSVAIEFPLPPSIKPRNLKVTRVGASYDFWVDGNFIGNIANPLQVRVDPPRWTDDAEPDAGQYGFAFQKAGRHTIQSITVRPLNLEEKYARNPVIKPLSSGWESDGLFTGGVLKENGNYYLYYTGQFPSRPAKDQPPEGITRGGVAQSRNLIDWTRGPNNPIIEEGAIGSWDRAIQIGGVVKTPEGKYALFYDGYNGKRWSGIGLAFSDSPLGPFKKYEGNPVITNGGPGEFDQEHIHLHTVTQLDDGRYAVLYTGFRLGKSKERAGDQGGIAFSRDLLKWEKYVNNPVLKLPPYGTFYDAHARPKGFLKNEGWYYLFFEGAHHDKLWFDQASMARSKDLLNWELFPYPIPALGTGTDYDSIVTEWPVPTVSPTGDVILFYMCLPLRGYGAPDGSAGHGSQAPHNPNRISICMTRLPRTTLAQWDQLATPLTRIPKSPR